MPKKFPIKHWSYSSLITFLNNPLSWHKRYVEGVFDTPMSPSSIIGKSGHVALESFYRGASKEDAKKIGLDYMKDISDFEINFGKAFSKKAKLEKRKLMEKTYNQAISFYLEKPPKYKVLGVEVKNTVQVKKLPLPIKAISDLVIESKGDPKSADIVDHKFVDSFSKDKEKKTLFIIQAIFNYYTVKDLYKRPVKRFIVNECKKTKNSDNSAQMRKYIIEYEKCEEEFAIFHRLLKDATSELANKKTYLPNPSDMLEGENSFDIYRLRLK